MSQLSLGLGPPTTAAAPRQVLDLPDAEIWLQPQWLAGALADRLFARLQTEVAWRQDRIQLYGKTHDVPRLTAWYGDEGRVYTWSGIRMAPLPWGGAVAEIKALLEAEVGVAFDSALLNLYRDGRDAVAWHADDEPELGPQPKIASVSLGATRAFHLRHRSGAVPTVRLDLAHGALLWMAGATQQHWQHAIPRRANVPGPRINITFRQTRPSVRTASGAIDSLRYRR